MDVISWQQNFWKAVNQLVVVKESFLSFLTEISICGVLKSAIQPFVVCMYVGALGFTPDP